MRKDAYNDVTANRGSSTVAAFQVLGSRFCSAMGRDACNDVTVDRDSVTIASVLCFGFHPSMRNDVTASIPIPSSGFLLSMCNS